MIIMRDTMRRSETERDAEVLKMAKHHVEAPPKKLAIKK